MNFTVHKSYKQKSRESEKVKKHISITLVIRIKIITSLQGGGRTEQQHNGYVFVLCFILWANEQHTVESRFIQGEKRARAHKIIHINSFENNIQTFF